MAVQYNPVRKSQIDQANGVAGLDGDGYLNNIGEIGHPPQINDDGAIEAIVSHRIDTLANLQALGPLPIGEIAVVIDGSDVPLGLRVGDVAETDGGYPITSGAVKVSATNVTLTETSLTLIPGLTLPVPADSLIEISGQLRFSTTADLSYNIFILSPGVAILNIRDGAVSSQNLTGVSISMTGNGGIILMPPTLVFTGASSNLEVYYTKISGAQDRVLIRGDLVYRVIG